MKASKNVSVKSGLQRQGDKRRLGESLAGAVLMFSGLAMLAYHRHWEPLVPIVLGAAFFDRRIVTDLILAWRSRGKGE